MVLASTVMRNLEFLLELFPLRQLRRTRIYRIVSILCQFLRCLIYLLLVPCLTRSGFLIKIYFNINQVLVCLQLVVIFMPQELHEVTLH